MTDNTVQVQPQGNLFEREPARISAAVVNTVIALLGLLTAFGLDLDQAQQTAIITAVGSVIATVQLGAEVIRSKVTPVPKAEKAIQMAKAADPETGRTPVL